MLCNSKTPTIELGCIGNLLLSIFFCTHSPMMQVPVLVELSCVRFLSTYMFDVFILFSKVKFFSRIYNSNHTRYCCIYSAFCSFIMLSSPSNLNKKCLYYKYLIYVIILVIYLRTTAPTKM